MFKNYVLISFILLLYSFDLFSQWNACEGLEGANVNDMVIKDSVLFISGTSQGIMQKKLPNGDWELSLPVFTHSIEDGDDIVTAHGYNLGFYYTLDNGDSWHECHDYDVYDNVNAGNTVFFTALFCGVIRSNDFFNTWDTLVYNINDWFVINYYNNHLILTNDQNEEYPIFISTNLGDSFDSIPRPELSTVGSFVSTAYIDKYNRIYAGTNNGVCVYPMHLETWIDLSDSLPGNTYVLEFYESGNQLHIITNKGLFRLSGENVWKKVSCAIPTGEVDAIADFYSNLYCGNKTGVYRFVSDSFYQPVNNGLNMLDLRQMLHHGEKYFVSNENRVFVSVDGGGSWDFWQAYDDQFFQFYLSDSLMIKTDAHGFATSSDEGQTWQICNQGINNPYIGGFASTENFYFILNRSGLYRSPKDSILWDSIYDPGQGYNVRNLCSIDNVLFIGVEGYGNPDYSLRSFDFGLSFDPLELPQGTFKRQITASDGKLCVKSNFGYYYSSDYGEIWDFTSPDTTERVGKMTINDSAFLMNTYNEPWQTSFDKLYISYNSGVDYELISDGFPNDYYGILRIADNRVFAGPIENGLWYRDDLLTKQSEHMEKKLLTIHPNPTRNEIFLNGFEKSEYGKLRVYNTSGQLVLCNYDYSDESVNSINVSSLKPGLYFVNLQSDKGNYNGKFVKY